MYLHTYQSCNTCYICIILMKNDVKLMMKSTTQMVIKHKITDKCKVYLLNLQFPYVNNIK